MSFMSKYATYKQNTHVKTVAFRIEPLAKIHLHLNNNFSKQVFIVSVLLEMFRLIPQLK